MSKSGTMPELNYSNPPFLSQFFKHFRCYLLALFPPGSFGLLCFCCLI